MSREIIQDLQSTINQFEASHNQRRRQPNQLLRPTPRPLLSPNSRQQLHSRQDIPKLRLRKHAVHPVREETPVFRIGAICRRNKTNPHESMRAHFIRIDLCDELLDTLEELPLVLVSGCSAEVDLGCFDEG